MRADQLASGLEGILVADTRLSGVDGDRGRLILAGRDVESFAPVATFEDTCALFLGGPAAEWQTKLAQGRTSFFRRLPALGDALAGFSEPTAAMEALRTAVSHLPSSAQPQDIVGAMAVVAAAWSRTRAGAAVVAPDPTLPHAADYLRMLQGSPAAAPAVRALETYFATVVDHGMNASTFAARVVASTGSDLVSSTVAALGALKGPFHGGAPGPVLDMLDAIGTPERASAWLAAELTAGRRIMGMGHRIYRVRDPRVAVLEAAVARLTGDARPNPRLELARVVERAAEQLLRERHPDRPLPANVEFATAVLLEAVQIPRALFSATFAVSRCLGWCAQALEQRATGRLIRPQSRYIGPQPHA